ncbi:MAG: hypothetical protein ACFBSC_07600 [Microcoleaceae cyanobacterium]
MTWLIGLLLASVALKSLLFIPKLGWTGQRPISQPSTTPDLPLEARQASGEKPGLASKNSLSNPVESELSASEQSASEPLVSELTDPEATDTTATDTTATVVNPAETQSESTASGSLRISNQTQHAVRVVLLQRNTDASSPSLDAGLNTQPSATVHWDFDPQEGNLKGLKLALPDQDLNLQSGDVLTLFAQDGSRQYWGPYIVGETPQPTWESTVGEWRIVVQSEKPQSGHGSD